MIWCINTLLHLNIELPLMYQTPTLGWCTRGGTFSRITRRLAQLNLAKRGR